MGSVERPNDMFLWMSVECNLKGEIFSIVFERKGLRVSATDIRLSIVFQDCGYTFFI